MGNKNIVSYFGYSTFDEYHAARLRTAHTDKYRLLFTQTLDEHNREVIKSIRSPNFFDSIIEFIRNEWAKKPTAYQGASLAWYFHHPETRKLVSKDFLEQHDAICGPMPPCYGVL